VVHREVVDDSDDEAVTSGALEVEGVNLHWSSVASSSKQTTPLSIVVASVPNNIERKEGGHLQTSAVVMMGS
jgi:predicted phage tail protein